MDKEKTGRKKWIDFFMYTLAVLTILPLAPVLNRYIPPVMIGKWNADLVLSVLIAALLVRLMIFIFRPLIFPAFLVLLTMLFLNQFSGGYGLSNVVNDYKNILANNWRHKNIKEKDLYFRPALFESNTQVLVRDLRASVDYKDSVLRNYSVKASLANFDEYHTKYGPSVRWLSLFKEINGRFKYVSDAQRDEYFAGPRETILNGMGGDCDDHTILMVSAMQSIGAKTRMILTQGHVYPELNCGDAASFEKIKQAVLHLFGDQISKGLHFREFNGTYWLNLDYTAQHPGGPYYNDMAYAIIDF
jgi:hypothetical protein